MSGYRERGPASKRAEERVRRNEPEVTTTVVDVSKLTGEVEAPSADPNWHSVARHWYESIMESAQCVFFEPSDWSMAYLTATNLDRLLKPQFLGMQTDEDGSTHPHTGVKPLSGADMQAITKNATNLMMTEVDRRRAGIEIKRAEQLGLAEDADRADNVVDFQAAREASIGN